MHAHRIETTVTEDGRLSLDGLPFKKGERVEVIVLDAVTRKPQSDYPLRGQPVRYERPFDAVAPDDWDANR